MNTMKTETGTETRTEEALMIARVLSPRQQKIAARKASDARIALAHAEAGAALSANKCPQCGAGVHQNLALTGWVQCDRSGAVGFRRDLTGAACSWQGFTR